MPVGKPAKDGQVRGRGCVFPASVGHAAGAAQAKHLGWRAYVEGADRPDGTPPAPCAASAPAPGDPPVAVARDPFAYFAAIAGAEDCSAKVTGFGALAADLAAAPARRLR